MIFITCYFLYVKIKGNNLEHLAIQTNDDAGMPFWLLVVTIYKVYPHVC
jgi:hypothetical protein